MHTLITRISKVLVLAVMGLTLLGNEVVFGSDLFSSWSARPHKALARFDQQWQDARSAIRLEKGWLFALNDQERLYLLIDLTGDTVNDKPQQKAPWGDYISVAFDIDLDGKITRNKDVKYGQHPGTYRLGRQVYLGPSHFSGLQPTEARLAANFGQSPILRHGHRIWEFSIPLAELNAKPGASVRLGLQTHSLNPSFSNLLPANHLRDLSHLIEVRLATAPSAFKVSKIDPKVLRNLVMKQKIVVRPKFDKLERPPGRPGGSQPPPGLNLPPGCELPEGEPVDRTILPNGKIELIFANGSRKQHFRGGWKILCPDGAEVPTMALYSTQIPPTLPPTLPDQAEAEWLEYHSRSLLGIISALVNDQTMVDNYLGTEADDWGVYQRMQARSETINFLLAD